jgi:enterochelin esterase-like enzyme
VIAPRRHLGLGPFCLALAAALITGRATPVRSRAAGRTIPNPQWNSSHLQEAALLVRLRHDLRGRDLTARQAAISHFVAAVRAAGTPLRAPGGATFVCQAAPEAKEVLLVGDLTSWNPKTGLSLSRVPGTDLFVRTVSLPAAARIEYQFRVDGRWTMDPWARESSDNGLGGRNSSFAMPDYRDRSLTAIDPAVPHGTVEEFRLSDGRRCAVYRPPGYAADGTVRYPSLYLLDGSEYRNRAHVTQIADTLIARRRIRPLILVMVDPIQRTEEYSLSDSYVRLMTQELVPRIDRDYRTDPRPAVRAIGGASMGGIAAAGLALEHPELFGAALCQSGAFQVRDGFVLRLAAQRPPRPLRFWVDAGLYDLDFGGEANLLHASRRFRDALRSAGYRCQYREVPEGHNWTHWRSQLPDALKWLFHA